MNQQWTYLFFLPLIWLLAHFSLQVLAVNAAKDATELVAKLRAYHHTAQTKADKKHLSRYKNLVIQQCYIRILVEKGFET